MKLSLLATILSLVMASSFPLPCPADPAAVPPSTGKQAANQKSNFRLHIARRTKFEQPEPDKLLLDEGELVIEALHPGVIATPLSQIYLKSGAVVLCQVQEGIEYIYVLSDNSSQSTSLIVNKRHAKLDQGIEAIVSDHQANYKELGGPDDIGHRAMRMHILGNKLFLLVCEYSLMDMLQHNRLLLGIKDSDAAADKALSDKLLKTVAVITSVTGRRGAYTNNSRD